MVSSYINSTWHLQKPLITPSKTSKAMRNCGPSSCQEALWLFSLPLALHQKKSALSITQALAQKMRGVARWHHLPQWVQQLHALVTQSRPKATKTALAHLQ